MTREELISSIEKLINDSGLSTLERVRAISAVIVDMGMSLEGIGGTKLSTDDVLNIEHSYNIEPTLGKALILQGSLMISWDDKGEYNGE